MPHVNAQVVGGIGVVRAPNLVQNIALMDLNPNSLHYSARRIARYKPQTILHSVFNPIPLETQFDSVDINYLLHCLPGSLRDKALAFDVIKPLMAPNAVLFGSTLLQGGGTQNWGAKRLMNLYNKKGVFPNREDSLSALKEAIEQRFHHVSIETLGCAAIFSAQA